MLVRLRTLLQKSIKLGNNGLLLPSITSGGCQYQCPESLFSQMTYYVWTCQVGHKPCLVTYSWSHTWHSPAQQVAANFISVHVNRPFQHPRRCSVSCRLREGNNMKAGLLTAHIRLRPDSTTVKSLAKFHRRDVIDVLSSSRPACSDDVR